MQTKSIRSKGSNVKKSRLFVSAGMVACLAIGLVGCGGSDAPTEEAAPAPAEAGSESSEAPVDESVEIKAFGTSAVGKDLDAVQQRVHRNR